MNADSLPFLWLDDPATFTDAGGLIVRLPNKIRAKQKVLGALADGLRFPRYFGMNWDALEESLRDLAWLKVPRITLVHAELPFGQGENKTIYLQILANVVAHWQGNEGLQFAVVFPTSCQEEIATLLAAG